MTAALSQNTELDFADEPLVNALHFFKRRNGVEIVIDENAFRQDGRSSDVRITRAIKGIPLRSALGLTLEPLAMICVAERDTLVIRPAPDMAAENQERHSRAESKP